MSEETTAVTVPAAGAMVPVPQSSIVVKGEFGTKDLSLHARGLYEKGAKLRIDQAQTKYRQISAEINELTTQLNEAIQDLVDKLAEPSIDYGRVFYDRFGKAFKWQLDWSRTDSKVTYTLKFNSGITTDYQKSEINPFGPIIESFRLTQPELKDLLKQLRSLQTKLEEVAAELQKAKNKLADAPTFCRDVESQMAMQVLSRQPGYEAVLEFLTNVAEKEFADMPLYGVVEDKPKIEAKASTGKKKRS